MVRVYILAEPFTSCVVLGNHVISLSVLQFSVVGNNIYVKGVSEEAEELKCKGFRIVGMWQMLENVIRINFFWFF